MARFVLVAHIGTLLLKGAWQPWAFKRSCSRGLRKDLQMAVASEVRVSSQAGGMKHRRAKWLASLCFDVDLAYKANQQVPATKTAGDSTRKRIQVLTVLPHKGEPIPLRDTAGLGLREHHHDGHCQALTLRLLGSCPCGRAGGELGVAQESLPSLRSGCNRQIRRVAQFSGATALLKGNIGPRRSVSSRGWLFVKG